MPRKLINTEIVTLDDSDGENSNDTSGIVLNQKEEEPASAETVLKIEKVFCGEEAFRINNINPALADVVFDSKEHSDENADDDDSDIEIIDMPVVNKKPRRRR